MRARLAWGIVVACLLPCAPAGAAPVDVEVMLLQDVNAGRAGAALPPLVMHSGLRTQTRQHSVDMAAANNLNHDGFNGRVTNASPDPAEANGPPDDGFSAGACENVAMRRFPGETEDQTASGFFTQWLNSPPHKQCMYDETRAGYNVAGVGVAQDSSGGWWATLILAKDSTPPSGGGTNPVAPAFSSSSGCGSTVTAPAIGGPTRIALSASGAAARTVTLASSTAPSWITFSQAAGNPATGTLTAAPTVIDWILGLFGSAAIVTVTATDNASPPLSAGCTITVRPGLF
jgi:hypothetical protein